MCIICRINGYIYMYRYLQISHLNHVSSNMKSYTLCTIKKRFPDKYKKTGRIHEIPHNKGNLSWHICKSTLSPFHFLCAEDQQEGRGTSVIMRGMQIKTVFSPWTTTNTFWQLLLYVGNLNCDVKSVHLISISELIGRTTLSLWIQQKQNMFKFVLVQTNSCGVFWCV